MKIRTRITFWVSLAGLVSSAVLSLLVFFWGLESPYEFLDQELEIRAQTLADELAREQATGTSIGGETLEHFSHLYWVRIYATDGSLLFNSSMARVIDLPKTDDGQGHLIPTDIPMSRFYREEEDELAAFWSRVFTVPVGGKNYQVHVARPVESLVEESIESATMIGSALLASALILIGVSYLVAGRILRPVQEINRLSSEITEKTLGKRIPLSGNKDEIDALAASLNEMFNRLHYSFQRQKEFVANTSHELKTPITLLRLSLEEILQDEHLPVIFQEKLLAQEQALARISQLVKNLLDLSRLELTQSLEMASFSLRVLLGEVAEEFQLLMQNGELGFSWECDGPLMLVADREKIRRVLINLLDNAVRYNQPGGSVNCRAWQDEVWVNLVVSNTGPGIGAEDLPRIFEQFYRCEKSRATARGGSGLGLTIVKRIVELHGGTINVESTPQHWTWFTLRLPWGRAKE